MRYFGTGRGWRAASAGPAAIADRNSLRSMPRYLLQRGLGVHHYRRRNHRPGREDGVDRLPATSAIQFGEYVDYPLHEPHVRCVVSRTDRAALIREGPAS